jgi:hypothetical protein
MQWWCLAWPGVSAKQQFAGFADREHGHAVGGGLHAAGRHRRHRCRRRAPFLGRRRRRWHLPTSALGSIMWRAPRGCTHSVARGSAAASACPRRRRGPGARGWGSCSPRRRALRPSASSAPAGAAPRVRAGVDEGGAPVLHQQVGGVEVVALEAGVDGEDAVAEVLHEVGECAGSWPLGDALQPCGSGPGNWFTSKAIWRQNVASPDPGEAAPHAHRLHRRRPGRPVLRAADEAARPLPPHHRGRTQPPLRHLRLGRRVLGRDDGQHAPVGPEDRRRRSRWPSTTGTTSNCISRAVACAAAATVSWASGARSCSTSCRRAARRWVWNWCSRPMCERRGLCRRRPGDRQRRHQLAHPPEVRGRLPARHRETAQPLHLAGHDQAVRRLQLPVREDRARLVPGPRLQVRRPDHHLHRRDAGARLEGARPGPGHSRGSHRLLRTAFRAAPARPPAAEQYARTSTRSSAARRGSTSSACAVHSGTCSTAAATWC